MGNSTIMLRDVFTTIAAKGIPDPRGGPSGYGDSLALECANEVMADIVCERYNQKFNRAYATPFYTNSFQQDYPQLAQTAGPIGWGEDGDVIEINNTSFPKPLRNIKWRRGLSRTNVSRWWPENLCWMYNSQLALGVWPGAGVTFYSLIGNGAPAGRNPWLNMVDANGNILIVTGLGIAAPLFPIYTIEIAGDLCYLSAHDTLEIPVVEGQKYLLAGLTTVPELNGTIATADATGFNSIVFPYTHTTVVESAETGTATPQGAPTGTTGATAPVLPANSAEGTVVYDGTVEWTCVSPNSQGFRLDRLPSAAGPTLEIRPYYQLDPPRFTTMQQMLDPIPDSFSRFFFRGLQAQCLMNSPNPGDMKRGEQMLLEWKDALLAAKKQGDRELNVYALLPASSVVEPRYGPSVPRTADNPYGWN